MCSYGKPNDPDGNGTTIKIIGEFQQNIDLGSTCGSIPAPLSSKNSKELLAIWAKLDEPARRDLLAVARGLAGRATVR